MMVETKATRLGKKGHGDDGTQALRNQERGHDKGRRISVQRPVKRQLELLPQAQDQERAMLERAAPEPGPSRTWRCAPRAGQSVATRSVPEPEPVKTARGAARLVTELGTAGTWQRAGRGGARSGGSQDVAQ